METFIQRLQTEFPTAQLLTKNTPPSQNILQSDAQCNKLTLFFLMQHLFLTIIFYRYSNMQRKTLS